LQLSGNRERSVPHSDLTVTFTSVAFRAPLRTTEYSLPEGMVTLTVSALTWSLLAKTMSAVGRLPACKASMTAGRLCSKTTSTSIGSADVTVTRRADNGRHLNAAWC
jgi:hypothetical protein